MTTDTKLSNPKEAIGSDKVPFHLIPDTALALEAMAFLEGALKYGKYNWRVAGVRCSTYLDALDRHVKKFKNGEWEDKTTLVSHLANARACLGILIDALVCDKLVDDRPPAAPVSELIDSLIPKVKHLKELLKEHNPHQYTISDTAPPPVITEVRLPEISGRFEEQARERIAEYMRQQQELKLTATE